MQNTDHQGWCGCTWQQRHLRSPCPKALCSGPATHPAGPVPPLLVDGRFPFSPSELGFLGDAWLVVQGTHFENQGFKDPPPPWIWFPTAENLKKPGANFLTTAGCSYTLGCGQGQGTPLHVRADATRPGGAETWPGLEQQPPPPRFLLGVAARPPSAPSCTPLCWPCRWPLLANIQDNPVRLCLFY